MPAKKAQYQPIPVSDLRLIADRIGAIVDQYKTLIGDLDEAGLSVIELRGVPTLEYHLEKMEVTLRGHKNEAEKKITGMKYSRGTDYDETITRANRNAAEGRGGYSTSKKAARKKKPSG